MTLLYNVFLLLLVLLVIIYVRGCEIGGCGR